jgi:hypothetical protein
MVSTKPQDIENLKSVILNNACSWYAKHKAAFWGAYIVTLVAYSYFFTQLGFSNHTFPQVWTYDYPSYRTTNEGRWFQDIIIWVLGGVGVTSSQMYIAAALQIVNSIAFAEMVGVESRLTVFLAAAFLAVYPAFCDRYIFPGSQIPFALADTCAVFGVYILSRQRTPWKAIVGSSVLFILCLASYQPNIALIAFLLLAHCMLLISEAQSGAKAFPFGRIAVATGAFTLAIIGYYISLKLTIPIGASNRSHINDLPMILQQLQDAYPAFVKYFTVESDYLPPSLRWLPVTATLLGGASLVSVAWRKGFLSVVSMAIMLGLVPVALRASYIINSQTWEHSGRIVFPYGFALLFFLLVIRTRTWLKPVSFIAMLVITYFSMMTVTQETNLAYLKMIFDTNKINRVAERIESVVPNLYSATHPIVIVGLLRMENQKNLKRYPNLGNDTHSSSEAFISYRQPQILNFYFGRDVVDQPTVEQRDGVLPSTSGRRPWPSLESVYVINNVIVVLLEEYKQGVQVTWTK